MYWINVQNTGTGTVRCLIHNTYAFLTTLTDFCKGKKTNNQIQTRGKHMCKKLSIDQVYWEINVLDPNCNRIRRFFHTH